MQAIDYVIRDGAGRLSRGTIVENSDQLVLSVLDNTDVSLNISRDDVHSYRRVGNSLIIELEDGREIVLENMFEADAGLNTRLYFSENGEIHEITFSEDWGLTHYAHFNEAQGIDGMIFSDAAVETAFVTTPETTMGVAPLFVGGFGGGAALAAGAAVAGGAVLVGAGGGGSGSVNAALASNGGAITSNGTGADNIANADEIANGLTVVGYTYPNTTVDVTMGSTTLTTTSDANGNYTVSFAPTAFGPGVYTTTITATITDADGNVLSATSDISVDTATAATMNASIVEGDGVILASETTDGTVVTGTAEVGANVVVTLLGQTVAGTADANGNWTVTFSSSATAGINDQSVVITAEATDLAGNTITITDNVTIDTVLNVSIDSGQVGDDVINRGEGASGVTFTGTTDPGAFVSVTFNGVVENATVAADGSWTVDFPASAVPGANTTLNIQANATDVLGNATSTVHSIYVDHEGMVAIDGAPVEVDDIVNLNEQGDGVTITGTSTPGSVVVVHFHSFTGNATVAADGSWTVDVPASDIDLGQYDVTVTATATAPTGNVSTASDTVRIDTLVDTLTHTGLVSGDGFINSVEQANGVVLSGTVEPGSSVSVELAGTTKPALVAADGTWSVTFTSADVDAGDYQTTMTATAVDVAGNTDVITQTVNVDTVASNLTLSADPIEGDNVINATEASDGLEIDGVADPGVLITVTLNGITHTTTSGPDGTWTVFFTPTELDGAGDAANAPLVVQTTDAAGNVTTVNSTLTIDTEVSNVLFPSNPISGDGVANADEIATGVPVNGTGEPGATVVVAVGNVNVSTVVAADGTWTVTLDASVLPTGEQTVTLNATITDLAGNVATGSQVLTVDTLVNDLTISSTSMQTEAVLNSDGVMVLNAFVAHSGIDIVGTVEIGSTVMVTFEDTTKAATVNADGTWSITFSGDEVPVGEYTTNALVVATDAAGNSDQTTTAFTLDTTIPDAPRIIEISTEFSTGDIASVVLANDGFDYEFGVLNADETVDSQNPYVSGTAAGDVRYEFLPQLSDGSDLILTLEDESGNQSSTLFVIEDDTGLPGYAGQHIDAGNAGLAGFEIEVIDLAQADDGSLTITAEQLENLSELSDSLLVRGGGDDTITAIDANKTNETRTIEGEIYDIYTMGSNGAYLIVDQEIHVITQ